MAAPTPYNRSYSFSDYQANNPSQPLPGPQVDNELENIEQALNGAISAVNDVRRADGALVNEIVTFDSLHPTVREQTGEGATAARDAAIQASQDSADSAAASASSAGAAAGSAGSAATSAGQAATARNEANTARDLADSARTGAQTARDFAAQWASAPENTEVDDGANPPNKSAYHWAKVAEGAATGALPDGSVTEAKIADEAVTEAKLDPAVADKVNDAFRGPVSAVDGNLVVFDGTTGKLGRDGGALVAMAPQNVLAATMALDASALGKSFLLSSATDFTVTLPAANAGNEGQMIYLEAATASGLPTLASPNLIDGAASRTMWSGETALLRSTGTTWRKVSGVTKPLVGTLYQSAATSLVNDAYSEIKFDTATAGGGIACHDTTNNRFIARRASWYTLRSSLTLGADSGLTSAVGWLAKNVVGINEFSSQVVAPASSNVIFGLPFSDTIQCDAGDYVSVTQQPIPTLPGPVNYTTKRATGQVCKVSYREIPQW